MARQPERAVRFQLNHHCFLPGAEGVIGQVIEVRRDVADRLLERGGGRVVEEAPAPEKKGAEVEKKAAEEESAES